MKKEKGRLKCWPGGSRPPSLEGEGEERVDCKVLRGDEYTVRADVYSL